MKKGSTMIIGVVVAALLGVGFYFLTDKKSEVSDTTTKTVMDDNQVDLTITPSQEIPVDEDGVVKTSNFSGKKLAGTVAMYLEFNKADYDKALSENRIIFLDFYASWCPICRGEAPEIEAGFDQLQTNQVVGFRVNYKDPDTDADEKALATQFEIPYQHHKVILKNGQVVLKDGEVWDKAQFLSEVGKVIY